MITALNVRQFVDGTEHSTCLHLQATQQEDAQDHDLGSCWHLERNDSSYRQKQDGCIDENVGDASEQGEEVEVEASAGHGADPE